MKALLQDVEMSFLRHKARRDASGADPLNPPRELEVFPNDPLAEEAYMTSDELDMQEAFDPDHKQHRKSPAAQFGSLRHAQVALPLELEKTIAKLIASEKRAFFLSNPMLTSRHCS